MSGDVSVGCDPLDSNCFLKETMLSSNFLSAERFVQFGRSCIDQICLSSFQPGLPLFDKMYMVFSSCQSRYASPPCLGRQKALV